MRSTSAYAQKVQLIFWHQGAATIDVITNLIHFLHRSTYLLKIKCVLGAWAWLHLALCVSKPIAPNEKTYCNEWYIFQNNENLNMVGMTHISSWGPEKSVIASMYFVLNTSMYFVWTLCISIFLIFRKYQYPVIWWLYETIYEIIVFFSSQQRYHDILNISLGLSRKKSVRVRLTP